MIFQEMREKVAVITGATSGIGRASALLLAQHGVKVILAGRDDKRGYELQDEISSNGGSALFVKTDVSKYESVKNLMGKAQSPSFLRPKFGENRIVDVISHFFPMRGHWKGAVSGHSDHSINCHPTHQS